MAIVLSRSLHFWRLFRSPFAIVLSVAHYARAMRLSRSKDISPFSKPKFISINFEIWQPFLAAHTNYDFFTFRRHWTAKWKTTNEHRIHSGTLNLIFSRREKKKSACEIAAWRFCFAAPHAPRIHAPISRRRFASFSATIWPLWICNLCEKPRIHLHLSYFARMKRVIHGTAKFTWFSIVW